MNKSKPISIYGKFILLSYFIVLPIMIIFVIIESNKKEEAREEAISQLNTVYKEDVEALTNSYYSFIDKQLDEMTAKYKEDFESNNVLNIISKVDEKNLHSYVNCSKVNTCSTYKNNNNSISHIITEVVGQTYKTKIIESNNGENIYIKYDLLINPYDKNNDKIIETLSNLQGENNTNIPEDILIHFDSIDENEIKSYTKKII